MGFNAWIQFTPTICLSGVEGVGKDHAESKAFTIPALKKTEAVASEAVLVWFRDVFFWDPLAYVVCFKNIYYIVLLSNPLFHMLRRCVWVCVFVVCEESTLQ